MKHFQSVKNFDFVLIVHRSKIKLKGFLCKFQMNRVARWFIKVSAYFKNSRLWSFATVCCACSFDCVHNAKSRILARMISSFEF
jgi:hypothetical protein